MQADELLTGQATNDVGGAFESPSVRVVAQIKKSHQGFDRTNCRIVFILTNARDNFGLSSGDLIIRKRGRHDDIAQQSQNLVEVLRQTRTHERHRLACHHNGQRNAARVEILSDVTGAAPGCAAVENPRHQVNGAWCIDRIANRANTHGQIDGNRRNRPSLLRDNDDAIGKGGAGGREAWTG